MFLGITEFTEVDAVTAQINFIGSPKEADLFFIHLIEKLILLFVITLNVDIVA